MKKIMIMLLCVGVMALFAGCGAEEQEQVQGNTAEVAQELLDLILGL